MQHWTTTKGLENARNTGGFKPTLHYCWAPRDWFHEQYWWEGKAVPAQRARQWPHQGERTTGTTISWRAALVFFLCISIKLSPLDCFWIMHNNRWEQRLPRELQPMAAQWAHRCAPASTSTLRESEQHSARKGSDRSKMHLPQEQRVPDSSPSTETKFPNHLLLTGFPTKTQATPKPILDITM